MRLFLSKLMYPAEIIVEVALIGSDLLHFFSSPRYSAAAPSSPAPAQPAAPVSPAATTQPAAASPAQPAQPAQGGNLYSNAASAFVTDDVLEPMIMQIMEMGFEREQIVRALNAANRNPDIAVQLLLSVRI
jgi:UV excision repair protein RAD23